MSEEKLREQLYYSFKHRAILYYLIFDEMRKEFGAEKAEEVLGRAIYRRGLDRGKEKYARFGPNDLAGLKAAFVDSLADDGRLFQPEITRHDPEGVDIKFQSCPLRDAWQEMGLPDEEVARMCRIAAKIDDGTFEAAGFEFTSDTWEPGEGRCCWLHIRPGKSQ